MADIPGAIVATTAAVAMAADTPVDMAATLVTEATPAAMAVTPVVTEAMLAVMAAMPVVTMAVTLPSPAVMAEAVTSEAVVMAVATVVVTEAIAKLTAQCSRRCPISAVVSRCGAVDLALVFALDLPSLRRLL
jgi:hypothetical protein